MPLLIPQRTAASTVHRATATRPRAPPSPAPYATLTDEQLETARRELPKHGLPASQLRLKQNYTSRWVNPRLSEPGWHLQRTMSHPPARLSRVRPNLPGAAAGALDPVPRPASAGLGLDAEPAGRRLAGPEVDESLLPCGASWMGPRPTSRRGCMRPQVEQHRPHLITRVCS